MGRIAALLLVLTLGSFASRAAVRAEEPKAPLTADAAAAAVAKAWQAKDEAALKALAGEDNPDPWLVADALMLKGEREAAEAFAKAAPRKDVEKLPEFVQSWSNSDADKAARDAVGKINAAITGKRFAEALPVADAVPKDAMAYLRLRCVYGSALALGHLGRYAESAERHLAAANELERLGWLARASAALWECSLNEVDAKRAPEALAAAKRYVALETARGRRIGIAYGHIATGSALSEAEKLEEAQAEFRSALAIFRELGDRAREAATLNNLAWNAYRRRNPADVETAAKESLTISEPMGLSAESLRSHDILGLTLEDTGRLTQALGRLEQGRDAAQKAGNAGMAAWMSHRVGIAHGELGDFEKALDPLRTALLEYEPLGPRVVETGQLARARLAWSLAAAGNVEEARAELGTSLAYAESTKSRRIRGHALRAQARLLRAEGKPLEAPKVYEEALQELEAADESLTLRCRTLVELAESYEEAKDLAQARTRIEAARADAIQRTDRFTLYKAEAVAARIAKDQGETQKAIDLAKASLAISDDLRDARVSEATRALLKELEAGAAPR